jgi:hypothetical protein
MYSLYADETVLGALYRHDRPVDIGSAKGKREEFYGKHFAATEETDNNDQHWSGGQSSKSFEIGIGSGSRGRVGVMKRQTGVCSLWVRWRKEFLETVKNKKGSRTHPVKNYVFISHGR